LGAIRLILENRLRLPLRATFRDALGGYDGLISVNRDQVAVDLLDFFADRLKVHLRDQGVRHDLIAAVFALGDEDDLVRLIARVSALAAFLASDDGANLLVAHRRAANIVRIEEKKDSRRYDGAVSAALLGAREAADLLKALDDTGEAAQPALDREDFQGAMAALARLRRPVDLFFDKVTVNTPEPSQRAARLTLLSHICAAMGRVADFTKVET
jgi:glycyl-tRNA synthetase beta chain